MKTITDLLEPKSGYHSGYFLKGIDKIVANDDLRPSLNRAWFKNDYLYATNAHIAVKIHLSFLGIEDDEFKFFNGKSFNRDALKELSKITKDTMWYISDFGVTIRDTKIILFSTEDHNFVDVDSVIPIENQSIKYLCIKSDFLKLIETVYKNVGGEREALIMNFYGESKAVKLIGNQDEKFEAIIMPVRVENN